MSSTFGKTSHDTGYKRNVSKKGMMRRHRQPLPLKASDLLTDMIELDKEDEDHDNKQTEGSRYNQIGVSHG